MIIYENGLQVGTLEPDGAIVTQDKNLCALAEAWVKYGFIQFTYEGPEDAGDTPGVINDKGRLIFPSAETLDVVVTSLRNDGYKVE